MSVGFVRVCVICKAIYGCKTELDKMECESCLGKCWIYNRGLKMETTNGFCTTCMKKRTHRRITDEPKTAKAEKTWETQIEKTG